MVAADSLNEHAQERTVTWTLDPAIWPIESENWRLTHIEP